LPLSFLLLPHRIAFVEIALPCLNG